MKNDFDGIDWLAPGALPSDEIEEIVTEFAHALLNDGGEPLHEFHFGCLKDRIEWDDKDFSHMEICPPVAVSINFAELGAGRFNPITPQGVHRLLFMGPLRQEIAQNLHAVVELERDRFAAGGYDSAKNLHQIRERLQAVGAAFLSNLEASEF